MAVQPRVGFQPRTTPAERRAFFNQLKQLKEVEAAAAAALTQTEADALYLTQTEADALYLTQTEADALYLTQAEATPATPRRHSEMQLPRQPTGR